MFLSIDVGNTQTAIGLFDSEGTMVRGWRMPTDQSDTSDILHGRLFTFFLLSHVLGSAALSCCLTSL